MATAALLRDPRAVKLSNQLRGQAAALAQRNITTIPAAYIDEVADQMIELGWFDLAGVDAVKETATGFTTVQRGDENITQLVEFPRHAWYYNGALMYRMDSPDIGFDTMLPVANTADGQFTAWMEWIDPPGAPIIFLRRRKQTGLNFMRGVTFVGGFLAVAAGLPQIIGNAVLGAELAATYPAAANAVGTVATKTVLTGGNVESAVKSAATGLVGAEFGDFAGTVVDSDAIGAAAGAATAAALGGGDPRRAAVQAFILKGAKLSDPTEYDPAEYLFEPGADVAPSVMVEGEISLADLGLDVDLTSILGNLEVPEALTIPLGAVIPDDAGNLFTVDGHFVELAPDQYITSIYADEQGNIRTPDNQVLLTADEGIKYLDDPEGLADALRRRIEPLQGNVSQPAMDIPNLRPATIPPPAGQTKTPLIDWAKTADQLLKTAVSIGGSIKAIANGTFRPGYTTSPYGTARPPVGVPVRQVDGSTVVNNGNGTQTVRYPDGRVVTMPTTYMSAGAAGAYGQGIIPGVPNTALLIGGGIVLAALLLSRR